jgi:hypothetical protein
MGEEVAMVEPDIPSRSLKETGGCWDVAMVVGGMLLWLFEGVFVRKEMDEESLRVVVVVFNIRVQDLG